MRARLEKIQRDFLWDGGALEKKPHLVNWSLVCTNKEGGLRIRRLVALNKALLGKWSWRFVVERESFWKHIIINKFGLEEGGWCSRVARGGYGVGVWKAIRKEWEGIRCRSHFIVRNGRKVKFWKDLWCKDQTLKEAFPNLYQLAVDKDELVSNAWEGSREPGCWNPHFSRHFNDWKLEELEGFF